MEPKPESPDQPEVPNQSKWKFNVPYASITSTFALVISCLTFYFSNLREVHSVQLGIARTQFQYTTKKNPYIISDFILLNRGNRTEAIMSINFSYPAVGMSNARVVSSRQGPYILKAGDAIPVHLSDTITIDTFKRSGTWTGKAGKRKAEVLVDIIVRGISPNTGIEIERNVMQHKLLYDEQSDKVSFEYYGSRSVLNLYDLL